MLDERERRDIDREIAKYPAKQAAAPEALKIVQRYRGWVSDEALAEVARYLGMTEDELDGVATAYNLIFREPVGRHVLFMCDSISCWLTGQVELYEHVRKRLGIGFGETTADGRFTLLPIACAGACDKSPVMLVDDTLHVQLDASKIDAILEKYE
jgi:NADH-quinone oxidoreductase subunit E